MSEPTPEARVLTLTEEEAKAVARQQNRKTAKKFAVRAGAAVGVTVVVLLGVKKLAGNSVVLPDLPDLPVPTPQV